MADMRRPDKPDPTRAARHRQSPMPIPVLGTLDALVAPDLAPEDRVEQAVRLVRRGVRTYLDAVGVIVIALDAHGHVLFVNQRGCELLGCADEHEVLGMDWIDTYVPDRHRAATRRVLEALWAGDESSAATNENEIVTQSGQERVVAWTNELLRDESGAVWGVVGSGIDVTDQRHAERALARVGHAAESAHDGIGITDLYGQAVYMNPALRTLTGYSCATLQAAGGPLALFADPGRARQVFLGVARDGLWDGEVAMQNRAGEAMTVHLRASVVRDERGRAVGFVGIHTDVTEQKRVERALRQSEARHRALVDALPDLVVLFSADGIVRDVQRPEGRTSLLQAPAVGRSVREAFPPGVARQLEEGLATALTSDTPETPHTLYLTDASGAHVFEARLARVEGDGFLGIVRDVTEQRRLEADVLRATDEERQRLGRDLHDGLGSHLVGLGMLARSLARRARAGAPDLADELDEVAAMIRDGAEQARALAHGLNPVSLDRQGLPHALARLAEATDAHTHVRCAFGQTGNPPALPSEVATQLYRIAQEAVTNALRHADARHVAVTLSGEADAVVLTVRDDGSGLGEGVLAEKTGLGLQTMAYRAHTVGGAFTLKNHPEGGTLVTCRLPRPRSDR